MTRLRTLAGAGALAALLAACGSSEPPAPPQTPLSPNGEPLVNAASCDAALTRWLEAADLNHDGSLDPAEFAADATRWFAEMDANHDGSITPDELTTLRLKLMPPPPAPARAERDDRRDRGGLFSRPRRRQGDQPDPVMSADVNLDNRVTAEEFQAQAARTFAALDRNRDGRLSKDEVLATCAARP